MASVDSGVETGNESNDSPAQFDRAPESSSLALPQHFVRECSLIDVRHTFPSNVFERLKMPGHILRSPSNYHFLRYFPPSMPMIEHRKDCCSSSNNNLLYSVEKTPDQLLAKYLSKDSKASEQSPESDSRNRAVIPAVKAPCDALNKDLVRRRRYMSKRFAPYIKEAELDYRNRNKFSSLESNHESDWHRRKQYMLLMAAQLNNVDRVRDLLLAGLSPNLYDHQSRTPLHLAACKGYTEVVRLLLNYGAKPDLRDGVGNTALHLAVCTNHIEVVGLLLEAGTDVCSSDFNGRSPLQLAQSKLKILQRSQDIDNIKSQVIQVINMLMSFINKNKDSTAEDLDFLASFQDKFKISDSAEQVETGIKDLLAKLENLNVSTSSSSKS